MHIYNDRFIKNHWTLQFCLAGNKTLSSRFIMYRYLPDFVSGDFDSVDPDLLNFYKEKVGHDWTALNPPLYIFSWKAISNTNALGDCDN